MFLATTRANSINVFKREERIRRWGGISRSKSVINKHCAEILNWIKLQWLVQEAISFPTVPSGKSTKSGVVLKLTLLLRNGSREKYGSNVLMKHSYLGDPFFFFLFVFSCWYEGLTYFLFPVECFLLFFLLYSRLFLVKPSPFGLQLCCLHWNLHYCFNWLKKTFKEETEVEFLFSIAKSGLKKTSVKINKKYYFNFELL